MLSRPGLLGEAGPLLLEMVLFAYTISGTCDGGLHQAWSWIKEAFGFKAKQQPAAA